MAGLQPLQAGEPPNLGAKTFVAALVDRTAQGDDSCSLPDVGICSSFKGEPVFLISRVDEMKLAEPLSNILVGQFAFSRPPMKIICKFITALGLKGSCPVRLLDSNHVILRPDLTADCARLFVRRTWFVQSSSMVISKWSIDFKANQESAIAPIWVSLPELPLYFFNMKYLHKLGSLLGQPLQVDIATKDFRRPLVARILIELDVAKSPVKPLWIDDRNRGFWQWVEYDFWLEFRFYCE